MVDSNVSNPDSTHHRGKSNCASLCEGLIADWHMRSKLTYGWGVLRMGKLPRAAKSKEFSVAFKVKRV